MSKEQRTELLTVRGNIFTEHFESNKKSLNYIELEFKHIVIIKPELLYESIKDLSNDILRHTEKDIKASLYPKLVKPLNHVPIVKNRASTPIRKHF